MRRSCRFEPVVRPRDVHKAVRRDGCGYALCEGAVDEALVVELRLRGCVVDLSDELRKLLLQRGAVDGGLVRVGG